MTTSEPSAPTARLLLVEDDPAIRQMYLMKLTSAGFAVTDASDGKEGWEKLVNSERPDLLLLDVVLPKKDGFDILRDIRRHPKLADLTVILLTNLGQQADITEGKKLGASDYVVKAHITPEQLVEKVNEHLARRKPGA